MKTMTTAERTPAVLRRLALLCIRCSGGARDANGAYTLCALCELEAPDTGAQGLEAA